MFLFSWTPRVVIARKKASWIQAACRKLTFISVCLCIVSFKSGKYFTNINTEAGRYDRVVIYRYAQKNIQSFIVLYYSKNQPTEIIIIIIIIICAASSKTKRRDSRIRMRNAPKVQHLILASKIPKQVTVPSFILLWHSVHRQLIPLFRYSYLSLTGFRLVFKLSHS